jgi:non-canonical purine NTP pyrophosphatase (RdgB/HAM1 family)
MKLVIATTNKGKVREILDILSGAGSELQLIALSELPAIVEPEETGRTFAENARLKALYYARATGLPCVADDSGIEIAALDNLPGVHSARWEGTNYARKFRRIYEVLRARGLQTSPARFVCHVALAHDERIEFEAEGIVNGEIASEPRGTNGFGYDPIFYYPPFGATLAEIDLARKATVSHRGKAFIALREYLKKTV